MWWLFQSVIVVVRQLRALSGITPTNFATLR
jgi:hypothetical protein